MQPSAADLKSLHSVLQNSMRDFKSKSGTRIMSLLVPMTFRSSRKTLTATVRELRKVGTRRRRLIACVSAFFAMAVPAHAATITIVMEKMVISPAEVTAKVGDTLELVNNDILAHTATAKNGDFDVMMPPNKTVTYVLKKAGTVDYYCRFHPNMKATLKVEP